MLRNGFLNFGDGALFGLTHLGGGGALRKMIFVWGNRPIFGGVIKMAILAYFGLFYLEFCKSDFGFFC